MTRWGWGVWLLVIIVTFGVLEGWAIQTHTHTLSDTVWYISDAFTLLPFLAGLLCGGLAVHFWWVSKGSKDAKNG